MTAISMSGALRPAFAVPVRPSKTPRDRLLRLDIEGERDAPFLSEMLDLVRAHAFVPLGMTIRVGGARMTVRLELDDIRDGAADALIMRLRNCSVIRKVLLTSPD
jgi:hypothetical protein